MIRTDEVVHNQTVFNAITNNKPGGQYYDILPRGYWKDGRYHIYTQQRIGKKEMPAFGEPSNSGISLVTDPKLNLYLVFNALDNIKEDCFKTGDAILTSGDSIACVEIAYWGNQMARTLWWMECSGKLWDYMISVQDLRGFDPRQINHSHMGSIDSYNSIISFDQLVEEKYGVAPRDVKIPESISSLLNSDALMGYYDTRPSKPGTKEFDEKKPTKVYVKGILEGRSFDHIHPDDTEHK